MLILQIIMYIKCWNKWEVLESRIIGLLFMLVLNAEIKHLPGTNIVDGNLFSQVHFL